MNKTAHLLSLSALLALGLNGCGGEPEWVAAYENCKATMIKAGEQMKEKQEAASEENPQAQAMVEAMGNMAMAMGMAACESIKQVCEEDPDGDACQVIVREYKKDKE